MIQEEQSHLHEATWLFFITAPNIDADIRLITIPRPNKILLRDEVPIDIEYIEEDSDKEVSLIFLVNIISPRRDNIW